MAANDYPPHALEYEAAPLVSEINDWSSHHDLVGHPRREGSFEPSIVPAPVTLFPSPFPRQCFQEARDIEEAYNYLYAAIASDEQWLAEVVEEYAKSCACMLLFHCKIEHIVAVISIRNSDHLDSGS